MKTIKQSNIVQEETYAKLRFQKTAGASDSGSDGHGDRISDRAA